MAAKTGERLVLTLPADVRLVRLARLVTQHFLRHNGSLALEARRGGRAVEAACAALLRRPGSRPRPVVLVLSARERFLEAAGGGSGRGRVRLRWKRRVPAA